MEVIKTFFIILFDVNYSCCDDNVKKNTIMQLMNDYDLPFNYDELEHIFTKIQVFIDSGLIYYKNIELLKYTFLFSTTLNEHKNLFLAMLYAIKNNYSIGDLTKLIAYRYDLDSHMFPPTMLMGYWEAKEKMLDPNHDCVYCQLQNYYPFDISKLDITNAHKQKILNYISGRNIKSAIKSTNDK